MDKTTIYLPIALKSEIKQLAKSTRRSEAETIREALSQYIERSRTSRPLPKSMGMISDGSIDLSTYEDWLEENWKPDW